MSKFWWFHLYSVHVIKHSLKWAGIGMLLDQFSSRTLLMDSWGSGLIFLAFYPLVRKNLSKDFRNNLEFHKMNVPFRSLQQAFFIHNLLIFLSSYLLVLISYLISRNFGGVHSHVKFDVLNIFNSSSIVFGHFAIIAIYLCFSQMDHIKRKYQFFSDKKNEFLRFIYGSMTSAVFFVATFALMIITDNEVLPLVFLASTFAFASWLYVNRAIFHQVPEKATVRANIKYFLIGATTFCGVYFLCLMLGRNDVLDSRLSPEQRISSFKYNGWFNPEIDLETFKVIEPQLVSLMTDGSILYDIVNFDPSILGVEYFVSGPRMESRLSKFLKVGKPSPEFLVSLYDHYDKNPDFWGKVKRQHQIKYLSFTKWPKSEKLPERFIAVRETSEKFLKEARRQETKRLPASDN